MPRQVLVLSHRGELLEGLLRAALRHPVEVQVLGGPQGLAAYRGTPPALLLLDATGTDGPDMVRQGALLRSALPPTTWVVLVPEHSEAVRLALELGFSRLVLEPIRLEQFADACLGAMEPDRAEERSLDTLAIVLRGLNHEVRNPLAAISGLVQLMAHEEGEESERGRRYRRVLQEAGRIQEVLDEFSHFLRHQRPAREQLSLDQVMDLVTDSSRQRGLALKVEWIGATRDVPVMVDRSAFVEALLSLAAFAAGPEEKGDVACVLTAGRDLVEIEVRGRAPRPLPAPPMRLFVPYHADSGPGPTGSPGLASAYGTLRGHEADVAVAATATQAVEFRVLMPRARIPPTP